MKVIAEVINEMIAMDGITYDLRRYIVKGVS